MQKRAVTRNGVVMQMWQEQREKTKRTKHGGIEQ